MLYLSVNNNSISVTSSNQISNRIPSLGNAEEKELFEVSNAALANAPGSKLDEITSFIEKRRWTHINREHIKLLGSVEDGSYEETKVWAVAFKSLFPDATLTFALYATTKLGTNKKAKFFFELMKFDPKNDLVYERPILNWAALNGNLELVEYLVNDLGVNVDGVDGHIGVSYEYSALGEAARRGHYEIAKFLIRNKANKDILLETDNEEYASLVYFGVKSGSLKMVKLLLESGAKINDRPDGGSCSLNKAISEGHFDIVKYLFKKGAILIVDPSLFFNNPIDEVIKNGKLKIFKYLIEELKLDVLAICKRSRKEFIKSILYTINNVKLLEYVINQFKITSNEFMEALKGNIDLRFLHLPIVKFLIESLKVPSNTFPTRSNNPEVETYLDDLQRTGKSDISELANCELSTIKRIFTSKADKTIFINDPVVLAARKKLVELYFVMPLIRILANRSCQDIAKKICSYLNFAPLVDPENANDEAYLYHSYNSENDHKYYPYYDRNKTLWERISLGKPVQPQKPSLTLTIQK